MRNNDENNEEDLNVTDEQMQFNINGQLFLESLLMMIRGNSIKYSSVKKKKKKKKQKKID